MEKVALIRCDNYERQTCEEGMTKLLQSLGGLENFVKPGQKVLIKANMLNNFAVEKQVTTNPMLIEILSRKLVEQGAEVVVGDSAGGLYNSVHMNSVYKACGYVESVKNAGAKLNDDFTFKTVKSENLKVLREFDVISVAENADVIINFAKLKTHSLTFYTGCVKNLFGTIPGLQKVQAHAKYSTLRSFVDCLLDLNEYWKPKIVLNIIDGIMGMEGPGPSAGTPKFVGRLIGGTSALACDMVGMKLMNGKVETFPQVVVAKERGLYPTSLEEVEIVGESLQSSVIKNFRLLDNDRQWEVDKLLPLVQKKKTSKMFAPYPYVSKKKCKGCKKCFEHCPNNAIVMKNGKAEFMLDKCIRCYCCQELCPFHLIEIKRSFISKILSKF